MYELYTLIASNIVTENINIMPGRRTLVFLWHAILNMLGQSHPSYSRTRHFSIFTPSLKLSPCFFCIDTLFRICYLEYLKKNFLCFLAIQKQKTGEYQIKDFTVCILHLTLLLKQLN
jgi:hypothetical protein